MGSLWIQTYRLNPSKPSSQESLGFNHGSVNELEDLGDNLRLYKGDCRRLIASLPDNSVDSVVTDPPYEIGFMMFLARIPRPLWSGRNRLLLFNKVL